MIDIHTHILPGIDDGPKTLEEAIEIARQASDEGVKVIVATPHVLEVPSEKDWQRVTDTFNCLRRTILSQKINIDIVLGAELFISPNFPKAVKQNKALTINSGNKYVLLELPMQEIPFFTEQCIFEFLAQGIVPIIAHPERCLEVQKNTVRIHTLVKKGALTQINAGSLMGRYGKSVQKTAKTLFARNLIHLIGSDTHSVSNGSYALSQVVKLAEKVVGRKRVEEMLTSIPKKIICGEEFRDFY